MENFRLFLNDILEKIWSQLNLWFDLENSTVFLVLKPFLKNIAADPLVFVVTLLALIGIPYILIKSRKSSLQEGKKLDRLLDQLEQEPQSREPQDLDEKPLFSQTDFSKTAIEAPAKFDDPELEFLNDLSLETMYRKKYSLEGEPDKDMEPGEEEAEPQSQAEPSFTENEDGPREEEEESLPADPPGKIIVESLAPPEPVSSELAEELELPAAREPLEEELEPRELLEPQELDEKPRELDEKPQELDEKPTTEVEEIEELDREKSIEDLRWEMERTIEKISNQLSDLNLDNADLSSKIMGSEIADVPASTGIESDATASTEPPAREPEETVTAEPAATESEVADIREPSPTAREDSDSHAAEVEAPETQPSAGSQRTRVLIDRLQKFQEHLQRRLNSLDTYPAKTGLNADAQVDDLVNRVFEPTGVSLPDIKKRGTKENDAKLLESFIFTKTQGKRG